MPELKALGRQIAQPSAPDISGASQAYTSLGNLVTKVASTVGEYVQANNTLIEKSLIAKATQEFETSYINYKNDPNINMESLQLFTQDLQAKTEGILQSAPLGREKSTLEGLNSLIGQYSNKALNDTLQQGQKNEIRDISLSLNDYKDIYSKQIGSGDEAGALETQVHVDEYLKALYQRGESAEKIQKIAQGFQEIGVTSAIIKDLQSASTEAGRTEVMKKADALPKTEANVKAFNNAWKEYSRLNKLYVEAETGAEYIENSLSGYAYANRDAPKDISNKLVNGVANNIQQKEKVAQEGGLPAPTEIQYQVMPAFPGQQITYRPQEHEDARREGRPQRLYAVQATAKTLDAPRVGTPQLYALAKAHAFIGSKNSDEFPKAVSAILHGGSGALMNDAVTAINHVIDTNPTSLVLDSETEALYTEFKSLRNTGRTDYDNMKKEVLGNIEKAKADIEINTKIFNNAYSNPDNLNKAFKEITGIDAIKTGSTKAMGEFGRILKSKFLQTGNMTNAKESTKLEMARVYGEDRFTGGKYIGFPPSKMLQGMNETQISNQFLLQLVNFSDKNESFQINERYKRIKDANDYERALVNYQSTANVQQEKKLAWFDDGIQVSQTIPGPGRVDGRFFVKSSPLTEQNNLGIPVWEAWMVDSFGREFPIYDDKSPNKNILIMYGRGLKEFAPEYASDQTNEKIEDVRNEALYREGREIYGIKSYIPFTDARKSKKAYVKDLSNIERADKKVSKMFGKDIEPEAIP